MSWDLKDVKVSSTRLDEIDWEEIEVGIGIRCKVCRKKPTTHIVYKHVLIPMPSGFTMHDYQPAYSVCDEHKESPTPSLADGRCKCGHKKQNHIYEEGACRPGFACGCSEFRGGQ